MVIQPDLDWYTKISKQHGLSPRCQFASAYRCPRFYQSLSLLGEAGSTKIGQEKDARLKEEWGKTDVWPITDEQATSISGPNDESKHFSRFCPEVLFDRFGLFTDELHKYADDIDKSIAHKELKKEGALHSDWRWFWSHISPLHYTECSLYSLLTSKEKKNGILDQVKTQSHEIQPEPPLILKNITWLKSCGLAYLKNHPFISVLLLLFVLVSIWYQLPDKDIITGTKKPNTENKSAIIISASSDAVQTAIQLAPNNISEMKPRSLNLAQKETLIISKSQFKNKQGLDDISKNSPGYFELTVSPSSGTYSYACALTENNFNRNYVASARIAGLDGAHVLELQGRGVWFAIDTSKNLYFVYESEENWTTWRELNASREPNINTLLIDQNNRTVKVFLNGSYVTTFTKLKESEPGPIGICFKANPQTGGRIQFQKLAIWELKN